ncbi:MAG: primosomal protein N' [Fidelibacterota bacterium]|nr:MAG: primosomal protein N' [Candidatus Neomarinimicrobiota bacterium]
MVVEAPTMYAQVILPISRYESFTYRVPDGMEPSVQRGTFVAVPFRNRTATGVVVSLHTRSPYSGKVRSLRGIKHELSALPQDLWTTLEWISRYYFTPLGMVLKSAFPLGFAETLSPLREKVVRITEPGRQALADWPGRAPAQRAILELLVTAEDSLPIASLREVTGQATQVCQRLASRGWVEIEEREVAADPFLLVPPPPLKQVSLTEEQRDALEVVTRAARTKAFAPVLLQGVTGSGKTEIYLQAAQEVLADGGSVLVLVPEIALTPQVAQRFRAAFGQRVALWHSHLSRRERAWTWQELLKGSFSVVVGARSALFAPLPRLRLLIVDEEQEGSYKQEDPAPRYHARDAALIRGKHAGAVVLMTSATPSVESYFNALMDRFTHVRLTKRFGGAVYPHVHLVDLKAERQRREEYRLILSQTLEQAIRDRLERREQVILLQNRRGFAPVVGCNDCGHAANCPHCSVLMAYHKTSSRLICHYCGTTTAAPEACPQCGSPHIYLHGVGTEQVEEYLRERLPTARIRRMDTDTTRRRGAHHHILQEFSEGKVDILLGTQMIAKGLDFANVTLVGVVNGDTALFLPDFRAGERTFQLVYQVCGRAGRRPDKPGEAIIQTNYPEDIAVKAAARLDAHRFYNQILAERQTLRYPPFSRLVRLLLQGTHQDRGWARSRELRRRLTPLQKGMKLLGPASAPYERLKDHWRVHLLLKSSRETDPSGQGLHQLLNQRIPRGWTERSHQGVRLKVDVDPVSLL